MLANCSPAYDGCTFEDAPGRSETLPSIQYREFEEHDWRAVEELLRANDQAEHDARDALGDPAARAWVAETDGRIVGWILTRPLLTEEGYDLGGVESIAVDDGWRSAGADRQLMQLAEQHWRREGKAAMQLTVRADDTVALELYRSLGYSIKEARLRMRKSLGPDSRTIQ